MTYLIRYEIIGPADAPETGVTSTFEIETFRGQEPTLVNLRDSFPFAGHFHFRAKVPDEEDHAWLDLVHQVCFRMCSAYRPFWMRIV